MNIEIREIRESDSAAFAQLMVQFSRETPYMLLTEEENIALADTQEERTRQLISAPNQLLLVACNDDKLVGFIALSQGLFTKNRHSCSLMIGVLSEHQGRGVATELMLRALSWAEKKGISRIELTVMESNQRAVRFYRRFGFEQEGLKRRALLVDGVPVDELYMARIDTSAD